MGVVYNCDNKSVVKSDRVIQCMVEGLRRVRMVWWGTITYAG